MDRKNITGSNSIIFLLLIGFFLFSSGSAFAALTVDGRLDEPEWSSATSFRDFVVIDPLTYDTPRLSTEARLLSTPEGIAVAFICDHPSGEPRTRTMTERDTREFDSDYVTLMIDFDGTGKLAYEFSVSLAGSYRDGTTTGSRSENYDWDGFWERGVNEEPDRWTVEILLPWSIAIMRDTDSGSRLFGVSFQRGLHSTDETFAFPGINPDTARYISEFSKIEIAGYSAQEFDLWPYVTVVSDLVEESTKGKAGLDLFWKPSNRFQVAATVNPDFGHVESDELVINFTAIETFFSDKRPFFTENQGIFNLSTAGSGGGRGGGPPGGGNLFYTRRVGGRSDDPGAASDIDAALKVIGSTDHIDYGIFAAQEADDAGRTFYAGRLTFPGERWSAGAMSTYVDRPFLDRTALVNAIDYDAKLGDSIRWQGQILSSHIDAPAEDSRGYGIHTNLAYNPSENWNYTLALTRYDDELDINDMGYMPRNDLEELAMSGEWVQTGFSEDSLDASVAWELEATLARNTAGDNFPSEFEFSRRAKLRSGSETRFEIGYQTEGYDDIISRGNGRVRLNDRWNAELSYNTPRRGAWANRFELKILQDGYEDWTAGIGASTTWYCSDNLNIEFELNPTWSKDWLIWLRGEDRLASFSKQQVTGSINGAWFPAEDHELRLRTQWYVIDATGEQGYDIAPGGGLVKSADPVEDFAELSFSLQLRYRYEIAPLSDLYVVYSRGGEDTLRDADRNPVQLLGDSTGLRDSDQFLVKLRYRF